MKRYIAASLLFLLTLWNGVLIFGFLHDASVSITLDSVYYWSAFVFGLCAAASLIVMTLVLVGAAGVRQGLILWIALTSTSMTMAIALFFSPMGKDSLPAVLLVLPQAVSGLLIVLLATGQNIRSVGRFWPVFLAVSLFTATVLHSTITPAKQVMIDGPDGRPELELYIPKEPQYYLRPFSAAIVMLVWAGTLLRPVVGFIGEE